MAEIPSLFLLALNNHQNSPRRLRVSLAVRLSEQMGERAVKMAMAMREAAGNLTAVWRRRGRVLGFGAGIAQGYATLGQIGFADRSGYTAIGTVCNLAARLCAEAKDGQILVAQRVAVAVEETTQLEQVGELTLKGLTQPVIAYNVPLAATQPALRVIEGGSQNL